MQPDVRIDACGLSCPMPLLKARLALNELPVGALLLVEATDGGSLRDIPRFAELAGHELLEAVQQDNGVMRFLLRKGAAPAG